MRVRGYRRCGHRQHKPIIAVGFHESWLHCYASIRQQAFNESAPLSCQELISEEFLESMSPHSP